MNDTKASARVGMRGNILFVGVGVDGVSGYKSVLIFLKS